MYGSDLTDDQWREIGPMIPEPKRRTDGRGRPWKDNREVLNGVLYVVRTGTAWAGLPKSYPPYQTCHRRFHQWIASGVLARVLNALDESAAERFGNVTTGLPENDNDWRIAEECPVAC